MQNKEEYMDNSTMSDLSAYGVRHGIMSDKPYAFKGNTVASLAAELSSLSGIPTAAPCITKAAKAFKEFEADHKRDAGSLVCLPPYPNERGKMVHTFMAKTDGRPYVLGVEYGNAN